MQSKNEIAQSGNPLIVKLSKTILPSIAAALVAETGTLPLDLVKVRLQANPQLYESPIDCFKKTLKSDGVLGLWKGLAPALLRQCCLAGCSMSLYPILRRKLVDNDGKGNNGVNNSSLDIVKRLVAGGISGGTAVTLFNWTEVIKTQMQAYRVVALPHEVAGEASKVGSNSNTSTITAISKSSSFKVESRKSMREVAIRIYQNEGIIKGFWKGYKPNLTKVTISGATELGMYDHFKNAIFIPFFGSDGPHVHLLSSGVAGVSAALLTTPYEVITTRLMNTAGEKKPMASQSSSTGHQLELNKSKGMFRVMRDIYKYEGFKALYSGFAPICARKVLWCSFFFLTYEQIQFELASFA